MIVFDVRKYWVQSLERTTAIQVMAITIKRWDKLGSMLARQRQR